MKNGKSRDSVIVASPNQVSSDLGEETVILNSASGIYYGLNGVGARVWGLIQEPQKVEDILGILVEEYDVDASRCEHDLMTLIDNLAIKGLIEVRNGANR